MNREDISRKFLDILESYAGKEFDIYKLSGDASNRAYYRVDTGKRSWIICYDESFNPLTGKIYPFIIVHTLFKENNIPVPEIFAAGPEPGFLLLEDLGDTLLYNLIPGLGPDRKKEIYKKAMDFLVKIQCIRGKGEIPFGLAFDTQKLIYEFNFFIEHTLTGYMGVDLSEAVRKELLTEFEKISSFLDRPEFFVLNHRDFHSRNIILFKEDLYFIDFQDARMGLPQYDLVSLLRDPYTVLENNAVVSLKDYYYEKSRGAEIQKMGRDEFDFFFDLSAFQRNVKVMGSFGFHSHVNGKEFYAAFISPALNYLEEIIRNQEELKTVGKILKETVPSKFYIN